MNLDPYRDEAPPRREVLADGAVLLSLPMETAHSVALGVWLRTGAQDEPASLGGVTHFLEHIVFKGSTSHSAFELASGFDSLGASVDAFTTKDHVAFTLKVLPEYLAPATDLLADMLLRPACDPPLVALEQDVVCEEIQEARDTPEDYLHDAFAARVFAGHPRGRPILGTQESVRAFDRRKLLRQHRRLFSGANLVLALAGNLEGGARDIVLSRFVDLPAGKPLAGRRSASARPARAAGESRRIARSATAGGAARRRVGAVSRPHRRTRRLVLKSPILQTYFEIGNQAVSYLHPDRIPLLVTANLLGGGMSSRIFQAVREREGLAYTIYIDTDMGRDIGLVSCAGSCSPAKTARVEEVVLQEYARLLQDGIVADELRNNRAQFKSQLVFSLEGVSNQMHRIAKDELLFGRFRPVAELVDQIDAVDEDAVMRCAHAYFDPDRVIVATHGP